MIDKVIITGSRQRGGVRTFAESLKLGFELNGIPTEVANWCSIICNISSLWNKRVLKIYSASYAFLAPISRNSIVIAHGIPRINGQGVFKFILVLISLWLANLFTRVVSVSHYVSRHLDSIFYIRSSSVIHNPLPIEFIGHVSNCSRKNIVFVGRLDKVKNIEYLIKPTINVLDLVEDAYLIIVGDGPLLKPLLTKYENFKKVKFIGEKSSVDVRNILSQSRVLISGCETEAFGIVYLEALSSGCNVVMPSSGGGFELREIYKSKNIHTFPLDFDSQRVEEAICNAYYKEHFPDDMSYFHPKNVAKKYLKLYVQ